MTFVKNETYTNLFRKTFFKDFKPELKDFLIKSNLPLVNLSNHDPSSVTSKLFNPLYMALLLYHKLPDNDTDAVL